MKKESNKGWLKAELTGRLVTPPALADSVWFVEPDSLDVQECTNAIIVYWAPWSAAFVKVWNELTAKLDRRQIKLDILLIHSDHGMDPLCGTFFGPEIGGWGEVCWVCNGEIIARDVYGKLRPGQTWKENSLQIDRRLHGLVTGSRNS